MSTINIPTALIIVFWSAGFLFLLYDIYEVVGVILMKQSAYRNGWVAVELTDTLKADLGSFILGEVASTERSKYKFVAADNCLFREKLRPSHMLKMQGASPLKGEIVIRDGEATVKGRVPLGLTGFNIAFILGALVMEIKTILEGGDIVFFLVLGLCILAAAGIEYVIIFNQRDRFMNAYQELKDHVLQMDTSR